jgi:serine/threonine-protein kinase
VYRLSGRVETGELSELFRGDRDGQGVVVKLFHPKTSDAAYARSLAETAQLLRAASHPGLAHVLDVGRAQRRLAVVRADLGRYSVGLALQRLNTREVHLPPAVGLAFILDLLDALGAAHAASVVHGALTPGNVLLGDDGRAVICDFGALAALQASVVLKRTFGQRGRGSYRAPELKASAPTTVASDLYAVGAIAYELLTLHEATTGDDAVSTRSARLPPPSRLQRRLHSRIDPVIMRALDPAPGRRYRSAGDFANGLREVLAAQGGIPGREDVARFVVELFPNEVQLGAMGPVPFERFELEPIDGIELLPDVEVSGGAPALRPSFSRGEVNEGLETSDGLPVFEKTNTEPLPRTEPSAMDTLPLREEPRATDRSVLQTMPMAPAVLRPSWDAPAAAPAPAPVAPVASGEVQRRMKRLEDFSPDASAPRPSVPSVAVSPRQDPKVKTLVNFVMPFQRDSDVLPPDLAGMRRDAQKRARRSTFLGTMVFVAFLLFGGAYWFLTTPSPIDALITYLPDPIERYLQSKRSFAPGPPLPPAQQLKLPDFDKPVVHHPVKPEPKHEEPAKPRPVEPPAKPVTNAGCYAGPTAKGAAALTVELSRGARVEIDGARVCGSLTRLPVAPGERKIRVIDLRTGEEYVSTMHFEAGRLSKLVPVFPGR